MRGGTSYTAHMSITDVYTSLSGQSFLRDIKLFTNTYDSP